MMRLFDAAAVVAAILVIWLGLYAYAGDSAITPPFRTFAYAAELLSRASFWKHVGATMAAFAMALAISAIGGVALGLGQRFHGSNHIRQPRRAYRTRCG
jgi:NitT/TauT family transport system permease protein